MTASTDPPRSPDRAVPFSLRGTPLLAAGSSSTLLARTERLWSHVKVYAEGGENQLHAHPVEDHLFIVLAGQATFVDADGEETVVEAFEGMVIPHAVVYAFRSTGEENLVMVRVGAPGGDPDEAKGFDWKGGIPRGHAQRVDGQGRPAPGNTAANKAGAVRGTPLEGRSFPE